MGRSSTKLIAWMVAVPFPIGFAGRDIEKGIPGNDDMPRAPGDPALWENRDEVLEARLSVT
jgi:hypothetical protein